MKHFFTLEEAAEIIGNKSEEVEMLCKHGLLPGNNRFGQWVVEKEELLNWERRNCSSGGGGCSGGIPPDDDDPF